MKRAAFSIFLLILVLSLTIFTLLSCQKPTSSSIDEAVPAGDTVPADPQTRDPDETSDPPAVPNVQIKPERPTEPSADEPETPVTPTPTDPDLPSEPQDPVPTPDEPTDEPAHEHDFGAWTTMKEASCTTDGLRKRSCSCGEEETEVLPALGHDMRGKVCARCSFVDPYGDYYGESTVSHEESENRSVTRTTFDTLTLGKTGSYVLRRTEIVATSFAVTATLSDGAYRFTVDDVELTSDDFSPDPQNPTRYVRALSSDGTETVEELLLSEQERYGDPEYPARFTRTQTTIALLAEGSYTLAGRTANIGDDAYDLDVENDFFTILSLDPANGNIFRFNDVSVKLSVGDYEGISSFEDVAAILFAKAKIEYIGNDYAVYGYLKGFPVDSFAVPTEDEPFAEDVEYDLLVEISSGFATQSVLYEDCTRVYVVDEQALASCEDVPAVVALLSPDPSYGYTRKGDALLATRVVYHTTDDVIADVTNGEARFVLTQNGISTWYTASGVLHAGDVVTQPGVLDLYSYRYSLTRYDGAKFVTIIFFDEAPADDPVAPEGYTVVGYFVGDDPITLDSLPNADGETSIVAVCEKRVVLTPPTTGSEGSLLLSVYRGLTKQEETVAIPALNDLTYEVTTTVEPTLTSAGVVQYENARYGTFFAYPYRNEQTFTYSEKTYVVVVDEKAGTASVTVDGNTYVAPFTRGNGELIVANDGKQTLFTVSFRGEAFLLRASGSDPLPATETAAEKTYYGADEKDFLVGLFEGSPAVIDGEDVLFSIQDLGDYDASYAYVAGAYKFALKNGVLYFTDGDLPLPAGEEIADTNDLFDLPAVRVNGDALTLRPSFAFTLVRSDDSHEGAYERVGDAYRLSSGSEDVFFFRIASDDLGAPTVATE